MTKREREQRRRAKHKWQKARRRENVIADAEKRLLGHDPIDPREAVEGLLARPVI